MQPDIHAVLAKHTLRVTKPRQRIFDVLTQADNPLSLADIIRACPDIDKVSVYRTIDTFTRLGITSTIPHGWKYRYELAEPFKPHHHHLHCTQCGSVTEMSSEKIEIIIDQIGKEYRFLPTAHTFEISGLCVVCQTKHPKA